LSEIQRLNEAVTPLVEKAQAGDQQAFNDLLRGCHPLVHRWALSLTADPDDADDIAQDVLVRVHRNLAKYGARSRFTTWLYQVTRNAALDQRRGRERRARLATHEYRDELQPDRDQADRLDELHRSSVADLVKSFFEELPERQREVFDLVDLQDCKPVEVSEMLDMNPSTVRAHLLRARRTIRKRILERHPEMAEEYGR
jgi:RNA polymerase sigma-70 factor (ECF subfamily)